MTRPASFTYTEDVYTVTVTRTAEGVEVRDSNGVSRLARGSGGVYAVTHVRYPRDEDADRQKESAETVAAYQVLGDFDGLADRGPPQLELCAAAVRHALTAPFSRDHAVLVPCNGRAGGMAHNDQWKSFPVNRAELALWNAAAVLGPL